MQYYFEYISGRCYGILQYANINMFFLADIPPELENVPYEFLAYDFENDIVYINNDQHPFMEWVNGASRTKASVIRAFCLPRINQLKEYYLAGGVLYNGNWISTSQNALIDYSFFYTNYKTDNLPNNDFLGLPDPILWSTLNGAKINLTYGDLQNIIPLIFNLKVLVQNAYETHMTFLQDENQYPGENYDLYAHWPAVCPGVIPESL